VAGIVAGKRGQLENKAYISGVAEDANIIAIQVFSRVESSYIGAFDSDIIKGLERIYTLRNTYSIASVNLSLGGGYYTAPCDDNPAKPIIDLLRAAGIATVIASGNESYRAAIAAPACISSAISVGSTDKTDEVSSFSNSADFLSLLAPGGYGSRTNLDIMSSVPGDVNMEFYPGTSMAAPHVAGAWAVLKEANPNATVSEVLSALQNTGVPIPDWRSGTDSRVKPRIAVNAALNDLAGCTLEWDLDGDCDADKNDSKLLKLRQKNEKTFLKEKQKYKKLLMKIALGYSYYFDCDAEYDLNGDCFVDKDDAKILKFIQKIEKNFLKEKQKAEKLEMKAALQ
jgi:subtilisin family serine protease